MKDANKQYVEEFGYRADLGGTASKNLAIVTCMDARVEPKKALGLDVGEANILRNAGARVSDDVMRSLSVATNLLDVDTILVIHHTNCGMEQRTTDEVIEDISGGDPVIREAAEQVDWQPIICEPDSLIEDVAKLRGSPLIKDGTTVHGLLLDLETGEVTEVPETMERG